MSRAVSRGLSATPAALALTVITSDGLAAKMRLKRLDGLAIPLSGLSLVHCLGLPVLSLSLPILGTFADAVWVHWLFIAFAAPVSVLALFGGSARPPWRLIATASSGLGLLVAGAANWPDHSWETALTVVGGVMLAGPHGLNGRRIRRLHARSRSGAQGP